MTRFVLDCSTTMAWCFQDEADPQADAALTSLTTQEVLVPGIWPLEVANVLAVAERKRRIDSAGIAHFTRMLASLPIVIDARTAERGLGEILFLARSEGLSAYEAAYVELALREGIPLATLDAPLKSAAQKLGIAIR
jgi:predicted nucleic acid-binding protein